MAGGHASNLRPQGMNREESQWYERCPKFVLFHIACYLGLRISAQVGEEDWDMAWDIMQEEWEALYANGIVPQRPPRREKKDA